jgi:hypothetical protein
MNISSPLHKNWILAEIATAQTKSGDVQGALAMAKGISDASERAVALARIAANWPE